MDKARKKNIKRVIALVCVVAVVGLLAAMPLIVNSSAEEDGPQASILSGVAQTGTIQTELIGGGTLAEEDAVTVSLPSAVKITEFLVTNGDTVREGDPIAAVDRVTVMTAIAEVQETLDYLAEEIEAESEEDTDGEVAALAGGTVKILYATEGALVQDIMLEHGALAVLSLDGLMAVDMEVESDLAAGTSVTVVFSDDTTVTGKVVTNLAGEMTVTVEDDDYAIGEAVQIRAEDGTVLGSGELYIYSPWNATAYSGTVDSVEVQEGETVDAGDTLVELSDMGYTATYRQLVGQRQAYEELMLELFEMYQTEQLTAPCDGIVSGVDQDSVQLLAAGRQSYGIVLLANAPNGDDETQYTNFIGQVSGVSEAGLALQLNPTPISVTDYKALTSIPADTTAMTQSVSYTAQAPVYALSGSDWVQIEMSAIHEGDILLFACDENGDFVWVVRVIAAAASEPEEPSEPADTSDPTDPSTSTDPTVPVDPSTPTDPTVPDGGSVTDPTTPDGGGSTTDPTVPDGSGATTDPSMPSGSGSATFPSGFQSGSSSASSSGSSWSGTTTYPQGSTAAEPEVELYGLDVAEVAAVTPQGTMTVDITVDELDITGLRLGMEAQIKISALGGEKFAAVITEISNTGTNNGGNSKFTVELTLERAEDMLAGMNATASVVLSTHSNVLTLPTDALVEAGTQTLVYTGYDEENEVLTDPVAVTTGVSDGQTVEILGGLNSGVTYYYAYYDTLEVSVTPDFGGGKLLFGGRS